MNIKKGWATRIQIKVRSENKERKKHVKDDNKLRPEARKRGVSQLFSQVITLILSYL